MSVGFLALLDDVSLLLDDIAVITKVSMKNTAMLVGKDTAINTAKTGGIHTSRELPVIWAIAKGALINKIILLPIVFLFSVYLPSIIPYILLFGGCYLAFEGAEKTVEFVEKSIGKENHAKHEIVLTEKQKVKSAILSDFIVSIEVIVLTLSTVMGENISTQIIVVSSIAFIATVLIYGTVALLVRLDDIGFFLIEKYNEKTLLNRFGKSLVVSLPIIVKTLGAIGTVAMLLISGGIFQQKIQFFDQIYKNIGILPEFLFQTILGLAIGLMLTGVFFVGKKLCVKK